MKSVDLSSFNNDWYDPGAPLGVQVAWFAINASVFRNPANPSSAIKVRLLRRFGAKVGEGVVIKPGVNIKYPWRLTIGDHAWIGENAWIDNLADVTIGANVCISQGAYLLTGNHDYKSSSFDLITGDIVIEDGAWIGARAIVCPGVRCGAHSILAVGSVASSDLKPYTIYQGNPAEAKRTREVR